MSLNDILTLLILLISPVIGVWVKGAADRNHRQQLATHELINGRLDQALLDIAALQVRTGTPQRRQADQLSDPLVPTHGGRRAAA